MKKYTKKFIVLAALTVAVMSVSGGQANADWWVRPTALPTQPTSPRTVITFPTETANPTSSAPTVTPQVPTITSAVGGPNVPTATPVPSDGSANSNSNPCAPGQSYTGPYCGWSPSTSDGGSGGGGSAPSAPRIGGPEVLGLSNTSSGNLEPSDIILLTGVLCLLLYVKSKLSLKNLV